MEQTIKALADLRAHWAKEDYPNISAIAKRANVARGTAHRYLTGATKGGTVETVRALAIAMDRPDIAESIPYTGISSVNHTEDYIAELAQQWQEKTQQQLDDAAARHKQEIDALIHEHHIEREEWHVQRKALHEERVSLRSAFEHAVSFRDAQLKAQRIEKCVLFGLLCASVVALIVR